jgi:hypothetical protein
MVALVEATEAAAPSATEAATAASSALIVRPYHPSANAPADRTPDSRRRTRMWRRAKEPTSCSMSSIRHHSSLGEVSARNAAS